MDKGQDIHSGHRMRMIEKLVKSQTILQDHELLEILLFSYIPRKNTNDIAHRLLRTFGSLENVINASVDKLMTVDGVGRKTATEIVLLGEIFSRINANRTDNSNTNVFSFENVKKEILSYFDNLNLEQFIVVLYDSKYRKITVLKFNDKDSNSVTADLSEIAKALAVNKPYCVIIAHSHPSGRALPSSIDDLSTVKFNILCSTHGVILSDHIIVAKNDVYSYFRENRLNYIRENFNIDNLLESIKEIE